MHRHHTCPGSLTDPNPNKTYTKETVRSIVSSAMASKSGQTIALAQLPGLFRVYEDLASWILRQLTVFHRARLQKELTDECGRTGTLGAYVYEWKALEDMLDGYANPARANASSNDFASRTESTARRHRRVCSSLLRIWFSDSDRWQSPPNSPPSTSKRAITCSSCVLRPRRCRSRNAWPSCTRRWTKVPPL